MNTLAIPMLTVPQLSEMKCNGVKLAVCHEAEGFKNIVVAGYDEWTDSNGREHEANTLRVFKTDTVDSQALYAHLVKQGASKKAVVIPIEAEEYQTKNDRTRTRYVVTGKKRSMTLNILSGWKKNVVKEAIKAVLFPVAEKAAAKNEAEAIEFGF